MSNPLPNSDKPLADKYNLYDLKYYENELSIIEAVASSSEVVLEIGGRIVLTRKFVETRSYQENSYSLYTHIRKGKKEDNQAGYKPVASICMVHGNSECSDNFIEMGIQHALNNLDVHIIDLKGQGLSTGERNGHFKIQEHHNQIVTMLSNVRNDIPCFI